MNDGCFCCLEKLASATRVAYFPMADLTALHYLQICVHWTYCSGEWTSCLVHQRNTAHTLPHDLLCPNKNSSVTREGIHAHSLCCFFCKCVLPIRAGNYGKCTLFSFSSLFKNSFPLSKHIPNNNTCSHKYPAANTQGVSGENCHTSEERSLYKIILL
jgi:hypothetical protein